MKKKVFISILTILISIPLFMDTPLANTTNIQITNHGTITYDVSGDSNESDQMGITLGPLTFNVAGKKVSTFTYELDNVYTGTITMQGMGPYFSGGHGTQYNCELYMTNCTITDRSDDKITFYIKEQSSFSVSLVRDNDGTMQYNDWYQIYSETLTAAGSELNTLNAIYVYVHSLSDDVLDIKQYVVNNLPDIYTALGYDVDNTSSTMRSDLETLKTLIQGIGTQIGTFNQTSLAGTITSMQSYLIAVDQKLDYIKTNTTNILNAINSKLNTVDGDLQTINTNLLQSDNIQWSVFTTLKGISQDFNTYSLTSQQYANGYKPCYEPVFFNQNNWKGIFKIVCNISGYRNMNLWVKRYGDYINIDEAVIHKEINADNVVYYVKLDDNNWFNEYAQFYFDVNNDYFFFGGSDNKIYFIDYNNIDYWILMSYFNMIKEQETIGYWGNAIVNAINSMSLNVNQLTVNATGITYNTNQTQVTNSINTYNTDIQNVYNVENDFSSSFNQYNEQFTPDFTETMTTIQSVPSVMNNVVVDLYNLPFIKYPILLTLAGIVLIALLGV